MSILRKVVTQNYVEEKGSLDIFFKALVMLAKEKQMTLYLLTATKADHSLYKIMDDVNVTRLKSGKGLKEYNRTVWQSVRTMRFEPYSIIFSLNLMSQSLEKVDDIVQDNCTILAFEWIEGDCKDWADRWNLGLDQQKTWDDSYPEVLHKGLDWLTECINVRAHHPLDDERIVASAKVIHKYIPQADLKRIKNALIADFNWDAVYANEFISKIEKLREGKILRGGSRYKSKELYDRWITRSIKDM